MGFSKDVTQLPRNVIKFCWRKRKFHRMLTFCGASSLSAHALPDENVDVVFPFCPQPSGIFLNASPNKNVARRQSSVVFSDVVTLRTGENTTSNTETTKNICSSEKMTQAGDGNIWQITPVSPLRPVTVPVSFWVSTSNTVLVIYCRLLKLCHRATRRWPVKNC